AAFDGGPSSLDHAEGLLRQMSELCWRHGVPLEVMETGAGLLAQGLMSRLLDRALDRQDMLAAGHEVGGLVQQARDRMATAFAHLEEQGIHAAETHGLFALGQNMAVEWERQRAALLEWAYRATLDVHLPAPRWLAPLGSSSFGLWLRHKAPHLFDDAPELALIGGALRHIDKELRVELQEAAPGTSAMRAALAGLDLALEGVRF
ncbi:hypothetical protein ACQV5M_20305, partial [Leptospira sp. SA-E8]|uniref:hypothetical protein n=1 Tax=Leptospira sp. SA-E8 TaxID=3422259 RepID=UPI003EBF7272